MQTCHKARTQVTSGAWVSCRRGGFALPLHTGNSSCRAHGFVSRRGMLEAANNPLQSRSRQRGAQTRAEPSLHVPPQEH